VSWIAIWTATALLPSLLQRSPLTVFGWRNVITVSILAALMIVGIIGARIDLHLPE
jgi:hypothetical protein